MSNQLASPTPADTQGVLHLLIEQAAAELSELNRADDGVDANAGGVLAAAFVALAALLAGSTGDVPWWGVPAAVIGLGYLPLAWALRPREFSVGTDLRGFYYEVGARPLEDASRQMLSQLLRAIDENRSALAHKGGGRLGASGSSSPASSQPSSLWASTLSPRLRT